LSACAIAVISAPLSGGVEIFQAEADWVDLAVAACTLGFFLVSDETLACGEDLTFQT
jgi:hypothetical protein